MKCYIYKIINKITGQKYVGQTTNFSRRKTDHIQKLRKNIHPNSKLQSSWNKYGENNFYFEKIEYFLSKKDLDLKEKEHIKKEGSYKNGFNLTEGGTGGNTRLNRILNFEKFCFAYFGNKKYKGLLNRTARYLNCDSSTISAIVREKSYDDYRERAVSLEESKKNFFIKDFEEKMDLIKNPPKIQKDRLKKEIIIEFLCFISCYEKGAESAFLKYYSIPKGLGHRLKTQKNYFLDYKKEFLLLSEEEIIKIAESFYQKDQFLAYGRPIKRSKKIIKPSLDCAL